MAKTKKPPPTKQLSLSQWAMQHGGRFSRVLKTELRTDETGKRAPWALMRTHDEWEKWVRVPDDVLFTLSELQKIQEEHENDEKTE